MSGRIFHYLFSFIDEIIHNSLLSSNFISGATMIPRNEIWAFDLAVARGLGAIRYRSSFPFVYLAIYVVPSFFERSS